MPEPRMAGVGFKSFRDLRDHVRLSPLSKINVVGGVNNSGKTAILDAVRSLAGPTLTSGTLQLAPANTLDQLDTPLEFEEGWPDGLPEIGFLVQFEDDTDPTLALISSFTQSQLRSLDGSEQKDIRDWLESDSLQPYFFSESGRHHLWVWLDARTMTLTRTYSADLDAASNSRSIIDMVARVRGGDGTWNGVLTNWLRSTISPRSVQYIPGTRRVTGGGGREPGLPAFDGTGFAGMLLALQSPRAQDFRSSRRRLQRITSFVREVLAVDTAELLVPHDAETVHVALDDRVLPLSRLGAGLEQLIVLGAICLSFEDALVLIEEPEAFLHPRLQRQLIKQLAGSTSNTYVIATHSATVLDSPEASLFRTDWTNERGTELTLVSRPGDRANLARDLGFRPSELVQANAIIWVEGPSDRMYIRHWLSLTDSELSEGIHYSFVLYGGRLGKYLTASERVADGTSGLVDESDFIEILKINRRSVVVMDSDLETGGELDDFKKRLVVELENQGLAWITEGYTIENYVDVDVFRAAYGQVHPKGAKTLSYTGGMRENPFGAGVRRPDKMAIAAQAIASTEGLPPRGDLSDRIEALRDYIRSANDEFGLVGGFPHPSASAQRPEAAAAPQG